MKKRIRGDGKKGRRRRRKEEGREEYLKGSFYSGRHMHIVYSADVSQILATIPEKK